MSAELEALIVKGMSVEPKARHQSLAELEAALLALGFDMRQEPDLEDANRTLGWFRQRLYDGDTTAVLGAFERHPALKEQAAVVQYVWSHTEGRVFEGLARSEVPDWTTVLLMGHLPPASLALEGWCKAQGGGLGATFGARWLHGQPLHAMPQAKINALVGVGGARKPEVLPRPMAQTVGSVALEPCAVSWDELEPIPNVRDTSQRFCSHCQQTVSCALNQGQLLSLVMEGQCVRYDPQSSGSPFRDVPPLSASGEDDFPIFASSEVVEQGDDESPPSGSLLRRLVDWWRR